MSRVRVVGCCASHACLVLLALAPAAAAAAPSQAPAAGPPRQRVEAPAERPTPRNWDQWQPKIRQSDPRLDSTVTAWERDTRLDELLFQLSQASGVSLTATEDLLPQQLSIYSRERSLAAVMVALAQLYQGYWAFRRGEEPGDRSYCLVEVRPAMAVASEAVAAMFRAMMGRNVAEQGESLRRRLALYRYALDLPPDEVLARFQQADPWLCADLLRPETRPLVALVCGLPEERKTQLINASTILLPLTDLDQAAREALRWCQTASAESFCSAYGASEEDRRAFFGADEASAAEDDASAVRLRWGGWAVQLQLLTATTMYTVQLVNMPDLPPGDARRSLLDLGYGERTPERLAEIEKEDEAWKKAHPILEALDQVEAQYTPPAPSKDDPLLSTALVPEDSWRGGVSVADLLAAIAEQCDLMVLGDVLPPGEDTCGVDLREGKTTLGEVLEGIRSVGDTTWRLYGDQLVVATTVPRVVEAGERIDILAWIELHYPVITRLVEDLFAGFTVPVQ